MKKGPKVTLEKVIVDRSRKIRVKLEDREDPNKSMFYDMTPLQACLLSRRLVKLAKEQEK